MENYFNTDENEESLYGNQSDPTKQRSWLTGGYEFDSVPASKSAQMASLEATTESAPWLTTEDALMAIPRGIESSVQGIYGLADMLTFDALPDYTNEDRVFGTSKTILGGLGEGLVSFMVPFWALGTAGKLGKLGKFGQWLAKDTLASELVRGGIVDFAAFDANDGRLSDVAKEFGFGNEFTQYLETDMEDSEFEGRLKNLVEGGILGIPVDLAFRGAKMSKQYRALRKSGASAEEAARYVAGIGQETIDNLLTQRLIEKGDALRKSRGELLPDNAVAPVRRDVDAATHQSLTSEVGSKVISEEEWRGTTNQLLHDTKAASGLVGEVRDAVIDMVGLIGERQFDDVSINIGGRSAESGVTGSYQYLSRTVSIFADAVRSGTVRDDIFHELWHSLEQTLDPKQRNKIVSEFVRQREAYFAKNLEAADRFESLRTASPVQRQALMEQIVAKGEYQYVSPAEWWATMGTASTKKRLDLLSQVKDGGIRKLIAQANLMWLDFNATVRRVFGAEKAQSMIDGYLGGRVNAAKRTVDRLAGLSDMGIDTVYARKVSHNEVNAINEAMSKGKAAGLTGIDLAATAPYPQLLNGYSSDTKAISADTVVGGPGMGSIKLQVAEGSRGDNIIRALARLAYGSAESRELSEAYLKNIGVTPTEEALAALKDMVKQQRKAVSDAKAVASGKAKSKAKSTTGANIINAEDVGKSADEMATISPNKLSEMAAELNEMAESLKDAGLSKKAIFDHQLFTLVDMGGSSGAIAYINKRKTAKKLTEKEHAYALEKIQQLAKEDADLKQNARTAAQVGSDRSAMVARRNYIELSKDDVEIVLSKLTTQEPEAALQGGDRTYSTTVEATRLSKLRQTLDAAVAKAEAALKEFGPDDRRTIAAQKAARKEQRILDLALENAPQAAEVTAAPAASAAQLEAKAPDAQIEQMKQEDPTLAAAMESKQAANAPQASVDEQTKAAVLKAQEAKDAATAVVAKTEARISQIMGMDPVDRRPFLNELKQLREELPKQKTAARTAEEDLGKLGVQVDAVRRAMAEEAAAAAKKPAPAAPAPAAAAAPEVAPAVAADPVVTAVRTESGPTTASLFPSTATDAAPAEKVKRVRKRRTVEVNTAKAAETVVEGTPSNAPADVVETVKQALDENPELAEKLKSGDAGDRVEAIDELADKVEAKAAEAEAAPASTTAAPVATSIDVSDLQKQLAAIEADYKKAERKYEKAKNIDEEANAADKMSKLAEQRDALKKQIADAQSAPAPTAAAPAAAAAPAPTAAAPTAAAAPAPTAAAPTAVTPPPTATPPAGGATPPPAATPPAGGATPPPAATPPAGGATPPPAATPPAGGATPPTTPSGHPMRPDGTPRRLPEEIGKANVTTPLSQADAEDLIWWAENNPASIGPAGINPRDLKTPEEILQAWLMDRIGTMNLSRMDMDGADASFLRTMERYIAGRDIARRKIAGKAAYTLKQMLEDGIQSISDETGATIEDVATRLYARGDDLIDIRSELLHGRLMLHRVNQQVASEIRILSPKLKDGSATHEELLFMLMRVASHGELTGAVNTVASEAGRLLTSLRAKIDETMLTGYNPKNGSKITPTPSAVTPTPAAATPPAGAATPTPAAATPPAGAATPTPGAAPAAPAATPTAPTLVPPPAGGATPTPPSMTPSAAHAEYSEAMRLKLKRLRQIYGDDGLENLLNKLGGRKHIIITLSKFEEILEKQLALGQSVGPLVNKTAKAVRTVGIIDFHNEWWINCLLSAGSTWAGVAGLSNGIVAMLRPLERMVGGGAMAALGKEGGADAVRIGLNTYTNMAKSILEMVSTAKGTQGSEIRGAVSQTLRQGSSVSAPTAFDIAHTNVWSRQNLPFVQKMAEKKAAKLGKSASEVTVGLEWAFDALRLPQRLILTGDELFKQIQYRAELHAQIQNSLTKQGVFGAEATSRAKAAMDMAILNGEFISNQRLLKEGQELALKTLKNPTADEVLDFAEKYKNDQWELAGATAGIGADPAANRKTMERMTQNAYDYARENTMQADPRFQVQKSVSQFVNQNPASRLVLPFVTTPMNAIIFAGDRSPAGWVSAMQEFVRSAINKEDHFAKWLKKSGAPEFMIEWSRDASSRVAKDLNSADPAVRADVYGRLLVGTALFSTAAALASSGTITGYGPRNRDERKTWQQVGNQPYSIKVNDKWISFNRTDPINTLFGTVSDFMLAAKYAHTDEENYSAVQTATSSLFFAFVNNLTNKSYLQGMAQLVDALGQQDPQAAEKAIARHIGSLIPYSSQMRAVTDLTDPYKRINDPEFMEGIVSSIFNNIPGLSDNNLPARDLLGKLILRPERLGPDLFSPLTVMPVMNDALRTEMTNLGRAFRPANYMAEEGIDLRRVELNNGRNAYDLLQEMSSELVLRGMTLEQALINLVESPQYQKMSPMSTQFVDSPRVLAIRAEMSRYRGKAWLNLKNQHPELENMIKQIKEQKRRAMVGENPAQLPIYSNG